MFDEFECLYEETKLPQLIASAPESGAESVVTQTSIEIQTDNANDSIIGRSSSRGVKTLLKMAARASYFRTIHVPICVVCIASSGPK